MRVILASLAFALPAAAQDSAFWAETGCVLVPVQDEAWVAELRCVNEMTSMPPDDLEADMHISGLAVHLLFVQTLGREPDSFSVTVPDGFVAIPPVLVLDEETRGVVKVMPWLGF